MGLVIDMFCGFFYRWVFNNYKYVLLKVYKNINVLLLMWIFVGDNIVYVILFVLFLLSMKGYLR